MPYNLKELGIRSEHDAAELEEVLGIKFSDFTDFDLWHWQRQTLSLNQFALTRSYTFAAQSAGVTVYTMRVWEQNNFLGYAQRKEIADLAFCDWLNGLLIQRVQQPDAPPSLLAMLIRAHMPEKYGSARPGGAPSDNHHDRPHHDQRPAPSDDYQAILAEALRDIHDLKQFTGLTEPDAAEDITPSPSAPSAPSAVNPPAPSPVIPAKAGTHPSPSAPSAPSAVNPPAPTVIPAFAGIHPPTPQHPEPNTQHLTRRQRRQLQRKQQKSHHKARAPN